VHEARLFGEDTHPFDRIGHAVASSSTGDVAVITAYRHAVFWPDAGAGYVFVRNGTQWTQQAMLSAADAAMTDYLGFSAAISADGHRIALGALWDDDGGGQSGSVYIFERDGDDWLHTTKITAADATAGSEFGYAMAMTGDGTRLLVGARFDDRFNTNFGAAYVFHFNGGQWRQEAKLSSPNPHFDDRFGTSVAIDARGEIAVIGAPRDDSGGVDFGAAHVFTRNGDAWQWTDGLNPHIPGLDKAFGSAVAISPDGRQLVVGASLDSAPLPNTLGGSATYFIRKPNAWFAIGTLTQFDSASNDAAGSAVAMCDSPDLGTFAAVAWPLDDFAGVVDGGSVRVFPLSPVLSVCDDAFPGDTLESPGDGASLLTVIANWGECAAADSKCAGDVDASGAVDINDLRRVMDARWRQP
jgi:hypothetical protein